MDEKQKVSEACSTINNILRSEITQYNPEKIKLKITFDKNKSSFQNVLDLEYSKLNS